MKELTRGQIAIMSLIGTMLASALTAFGVSATKIAVVEEREKNHYEEIEKRLDSIDSNIQTLINQQ